MIYRYCLLTAITILGLSSAIANAQSNPLYHQVGNQKSVISQQQAVSIAQQHFPGRLLSVHRLADSYRVKILSSKGIVHVVTVNANSGEVIASH